MDSTKEEIQKLRADAEDRATKTWYDQALPVHIEQVIEALDELSDIQIQKNLWAGEKNPGNKIGSFDEAVCSLYDDTGLGDFLEKGRTGLNPEIDSLLEKLESVLKKIDDQKSPLEIISNPKMENVRILAKQIKSLIQDYKK